MRRDIIDIVRYGWLEMTYGLVGFFGIYYILFWFCLNSMGVQLPFAYMFGAYTVGRLLTAVGITPGGLGVTEAGTAAVLVGWGADPAQATAGVVLFSLFTHFFEVPLGVIGWLIWLVSPKTPAADAQEDDDDDGDDRDDRDARSRRRRRRRAPVLARTRPHPGPRAAETEAPLGR